MVHMGLIALFIAMIFTICVYHDTQVKKDSLFLGAVMFICCLALLLSITKEKFRHISNIEKLKDVYQVACKQENGRIYYLVKYSKDDEFKEVVR